MAIGIDTATEKLDILGNLKVRGKVIADSLNVKGSVTVIDTIRVFGPLKIGTNVLTIGGVTPLGQTNDNFTSDAGIVNFGNENPPFSNITITIGGENTTFLPNIKLQLDDNTSANPNSVFQLFTNTGKGITNGFRLGIDNSGVAILNQQEFGKNILLQTNGGSVGISNLPNLSIPAVLTDRLVAANSAGELKDIDFPTTTNQFLRGDGTWATPECTCETAVLVLAKRVENLEKIIA